MIHHNDGTSHCPAGYLYQTFIDGQWSCLGKGGRRSSAVACWASDHWVARSNPPRGKFRH